MKDLQLKFMKLEKSESWSAKQKPNEGETNDYIYWYIWCDNTEHLKGDFRSNEDLVERKFIFY